MSASTGPVRTDAGAADRAFFGLELDQSNLHGSFTVTDPFSNPRGTFYGGAGVAVTVAMMEAATDRRILWTTLQFLGGATRGDRLECTADVRAHGRRTSQVRVTALLEGAEVFTAVGATCVLRDDLTATIARMPTVPAPDDCPVADAIVPGDLSHSRFSVTEHRVAAERDALEGTGAQAAFWARVNGMSATPAILGYVGDAAALALYRALDRQETRATSLDNTLRIGPPVETEWMLLELRGDFAAGGYGHGTVHMWAPDGTLLAIMSQTLAFRTER